MKISDKYSIQDSEYIFPYHYLPSVTPDGQIRIFKSLGWGLEYMTYITYLVDQILAIQPGSICDVGCGDGRLLNLLPQVPQRVGIDLSSQAIAFASAFEPQVQFQDSLLHETNETFDLVTCIEVLEHVSPSELSTVVDDLHSRVAKGGALIVCVPTTVRKKVSAKHYRHYDLQLLAEHLHPHFHISRSVFLFKVCTFTSLLNHLLSNRFFLLNYPAALRAIWRLHKAHSYFASPHDGAHLVALASPKPVKQFSFCSFSLPGEQCK